MLEPLHLHRFHARHHAVDEAGLRLARAVQARLLEAELEAALQSAAGAAAAAPEVLLLRRVAVRVRLDPRASEQHNARLWSDALALGMRRALAHAPAAERLVFARRGRALQAFFEAQLLGLSAHDWAWQRLGWLPGQGGGAITPEQRWLALLRLLTGKPEDAMPLLLTLLERNGLAPLLGRLEAAQLRELAEALLAWGLAASAAAFDAPDAILTASRAAAEPLQTGRPEALPGTVAEALRTVSTGDGALIWALRIVAMLARPGLARQGPRAVDALCARWVQATPALLRRLDPAGAGRRPQLPLSSDTAAPPDADMADAAPRPPEPTGAAQAVVRTAYGGLLLLLPLLPDCGALALLEDARVWPAGSLPLALHRLALLLWPHQAADDAAALAFCGLAPGAPCPEADPQAALAEAQAQALASAAELLLAALSRRLPDWRGSALLARVVRRHAIVRAEPGWLELVFPLSEVSIELRRAALDLDPGFLPWLGLVLRYVYE